MDKIVRLKAMLIEHGWCIDTVIRFGKTLEEVRQMQNSSSLLLEIIDTIRENISDYNTRRNIFVEIIGSFEDRDTEDMEDCLGEDEAFDEAWDIAFPVDALEELEVEE